MADDSEPSEVVMRKAKDSYARYKLDCGLSDASTADEEARKKVKWSNSTELREKMKEYRRSQLSICLDYHHIAIEEEREREGVKKWRELKDKLQSPDDEVEETIAAIKEASDVIDTTVEDSNDKDDNEIDDNVDDGVDGMSDSDDDPYCDEALETRLRVIKAKSSRHTLLPAYIAGVATYETFLASEQSSSISEQQRTDMTSQLNVYKQVVDLYDEWGDPDDFNKIDESYRDVLEKLVEARKLCEAPQTVIDSINSVLNNPDNVKKHKEIYSHLVDSMVTDLSKQIQTTAL